MRVRWQEIEENFARRVRMRLLHTLPAPERLSVAWHLFAWLVSLLFFAAYLGICFHATGPVGLIGISVMPMALMGIALGPAYVFARRDPEMPRHALPRQIPASAFADAVRGVAENPVERTYAELLLAVHYSVRTADSAFVPAESETIRTLLAQCARLVSRSRAIAAQQAHLEGLLATDKAVPRIPETLTLDTESPLDLLRADTIAQTTPLPVLARNLSEQQATIHAALDLARTVLVQRGVSAVVLGAGDLFEEVEALRTTLRTLAARTAATMEAPSTLSVGSRGQLP